MKVCRLCLTALLFTGILLLPSSANGAYMLDKREIDCLAKMVYQEARGEGREGMVAVAYVAINRAESGAFPATICETVHQPYQFEGMTKPFHPSREPEAWKQAQDIAALSLSGMIKDVTDGATHFHTTQIRPRWARFLEKLTIIGNHVFYR